MEIEEGHALHYDVGRQGCVPRGIVVHTNVGSLASTLDWFADPRSGVSAHWLVGLDGRVVRLVDERDTARHAGRVSNPSTPLYDGTDPNLYTIGIEFEDGRDPSGVERPRAQYDAGAQVIAAAARRWRIPIDREHVVGHRELTDRKTCPGNLDVDRLVAEAATVAANRAA